LTGFGDQDHDDFLNHGKFLCDLEVVGGFFDGDLHTVEMVRCDEEDREAFKDPKKEQKDAID
jgi:hypothetical protein